MDEQIRKVNPTEKVEFPSKDLRKAHDDLLQKAKDDNKKNSNYQKEADIQNKKVSREQHKKGTAPKIIIKETDVNEVKQYMEGNSRNEYYKLMAIMNKDTESAIKYLAELSKKRAKNKNPRTERDDTLNR